MSGVRIAFPGSFSAHRFSLPMSAFFLTRVDYHSYSLLSRLSPIPSLLQPGESLENRSFMGSEFFNLDEKTRIEFLTGHRHSMVRLYVYVYIYNIDRVNPNPILFLFHASKQNSICVCLYIIYRCKYISIERDRYIETDRAPHGTPPLHDTRPVLSVTY